MIAALATRHDLSPEGYLASSEALLQSLATDEIPTDADSALEPTADTWIDSWSTPLGLGALMLLLVSSAGIGYALTNPAAVSHIPLINGWSEASENEKTVSADSSTAATSDSAFYSFGPNLSSQEFVELNLSSLSTLHASQSAPLNPSATSTATTSAPVTTRTPAAAATPAPVATTPLPAAPLATARPAEPTAPAAPAAPAASRPASPAPARTALPPAASPSAPPARPVPAAAAPPTSRQSPRRRPLLCSN
ncbi:MAG: hypothetical protein HC886_09165 [Leptolyngbyaceae cyanobacterium SM1_1_3]|nr:hypothetical protein [Leptolyngbyaceae cyanobacterium SM1_1_3]